MKELGKLENEVETEKRKEKKTAKKQTKLSYKDQRDLERLPPLIDELETRIDAINECLYSPDCYQEKGLTALTEELERLQSEYDALSERYLEVLELQEEFENQ